MNNKELPTIPRLKIGTLKISDDISGQRFGEGAIGIALWRWQETKYDQVYLTVYEKHESLINLLIKFGFEDIGINQNGERVLMKDRNRLDFSDPYKCFPFIGKDFNRAKLVPINDSFHDKLFPYSELYGNKLEVEEVSAGNGVTKIFVATPFSKLDYIIGMPVLIYRKYTEVGNRGYKSVVTSFCTITNIINIKSDGKELYSFNDFVKIAGNKTVYSKSELENAYNKNNVVVLEMLYNGYFGKGHNITYNTMNSMGMFNGYPYTLNYTRDQFINVLKEGDRDVHNIIID